MDLEQIAAIIAERDAQIAAASSEADLNRLMIEGEILAARVRNLRDDLRRQQQDLSRCWNLIKAISGTTQARERSAALINLLG